MKPFPMLTLTGVERKKKQIQFELAVNMKRYMSLLILAVLLLSACTHSAPEYLLSSYTVGRVKIMSQGIEHELYRRITHAAVRAQPEGNVLQVSGVTTPVGMIFDRLPVIQYASDFEVIIIGEDAVWVSYRLYSDYFENATRMDELTFTFSEGLYILVIEVTWSHYYHRKTFTTVEYIATICK